MIRTRLQFLVFSFFLVFALAEEEDCECVPYYQCEDGKIVSTGEGLLDIRIKTCTGIDVCCGISKGETYPGTSTTEYPPRPVDPYPPQPVDPYPPQPVDPYPPQPVEPYPPHPVDPVQPRPTPPPHKPIDINAYTLPQVAPGQGCGRKRLPGWTPPLGDDSFRITGYAGFPEETFYGESPWVTRILKLHTEPDQEDKYQCGGTLITPSVVLTAAHCLPNGKAEGLFVRVGDWNVRNTDEPIAHQDRKIVKVAIHPDFNSRNLANDVALLGLESPVTLSETVDYVCTPDKENPINTTACIAVGWGKNDMYQYGTYQDTLRRVKLPIISREECQARLRKTKLGKYFTLLPGFLCAGGEPDSDTCKGDGGGPLVCPLLHNPNRYVQMGIIAWGIDCGKGNPAVFASVADYMPWIKQQIAQ